MLNPKNLLNGQEQYEIFDCPVAKKALCQYDYRHTDGELFSTIARNLETAREIRDEWLEKKEVSPE